MRYCKALLCRQNIIYIPDLCATSPGKELGVFSSVPRIHDRVRQSQSPPCGVGLLCAPSKYSAVVDTKRMGCVRESSSAVPHVSSHHVHCVYLGTSLLTTLSKSAILCPEIATFLSLSVSLSHGRKWCLG